jgi:hypothetical protein
VSWITIPLLHPGQKLPAVDRGGCRAIPWLKLIALVENNLQLNKNINKKNPWRYRLCRTLAGRAAAAGRLPNKNITDY